MIEKEDRERGVAECSPAASPSPDASDEAISRAKREGAAAQIRAIREAGQHRIAERFRAHLQDHGEEHLTFAEDFLRETEKSHPRTDSVLGQLHRGQDGPPFVQAFPGRAVKLPLPP